MGAKNMMDQFKEKGKHLSVDPSDNLWDRLEDKLDNHQEVKQVSKFRFLNYAASFVLLIAATAFIWFSFFQPSPAFAANGNFQIEEMIIDESDRHYYHQLNSQTEAYRRQLLKLYGSDKGFSVSGG